MLTIGRLAAYAGVTVRAVHFYHQRGLLAEPLRDASGYRRYDAAAAVELIRIRTLTDAGVPLSRISELLRADREEFAAAIADIDRRLRAEIRTKQQHRRRIAQLAASDDLALPSEALDYINELRKLGFPDELVRLERDAWILVAAQLPQHMPALMDLKRSQLDDPDVIAVYHDLLATTDWSPDDPRVPAIADKLAAFLDATWQLHPESYDDQLHLDDELVDLLDSIFIDSLPIARKLLEELERRGWSGWTRLERTQRPPAGQCATDGEAEVLPARGTV